MYRCKDCITCIHKQKCTRCPITNRNMVQMKHGIVYCDNGSAHKSKWDEEGNYGRQDSSKCPKA